MVDEPGRQMRAEIAEQPAVLAAAVAGRAGVTGVTGVAARVAAHSPRFALFAARGSSDHAALYAKYLTEVLLQLPSGLVSPSTTTLYGARPDLSGVLYVTVSQSGGSPDLVEATRAAREQGALTVGVYSMRDAVIDAMTETTLRSGVALSINLTGGVFVNQSAAFSDFHATGANPAANASYSDSAFVANRFRVIQRRAHTAPAVAPTA